MAKKSNFDIQKYTGKLVYRIDLDNERGDVYVVLFPITRVGLTVPIGFRSDGASVPRFFWRYVFPPGDVHAFCAAVVHDFIYRTHPFGWTKSDADKVFFDMLVADGVSERRARRAYWGVKWFGKSAWKTQGGTVK